HSASVSRTSRRAWLTWAGSRRNRQLTERSWVTVGGITAPDEDIEPLGLLACTVAQAIGYDAARGRFRPNLPPLPPHRRPVRAQVSNAGRRAEGTTVPLASPADDTGRRHEESRPCDRNHGRLDWAGVHPGRRAACPSLPVWGT